MTRFLVCGSRDWDHDEIVRAELDALPSAATLIHGACPTGADAIAARWWAHRGGPAWPFPANWSRDGRAAGPLRNQRMLDEGKPEMVIAFHKGASRGTADMIARARKAGVAVKVITP